MADSRLNWRKRKQYNNPKRQKPHDDDKEEEDNDEAAAEEAAEEDDDHASQANNSASDPILDLREAEVLFDVGQRISNFPAAVRHVVNHPHPSVLAIAAAERSPFSSSSTSVGTKPWASPLLENISHGQLQALSAVLPDNPSLLQPPDLDKPSAYVCTPPSLMEGKGVVKRQPTRSLWRQPPPTTS